MTGHIQGSQTTETRRDAVTILVVDDDRVDVRAIRRSLRKAGMANPVVSVSNGLEALGVLRGERPDVSVDPRRTLVLLDLNMPRMNGIEFLEELRGDPELEATPVLVHTTSEAPEDRAAVARFSVVGYVPKVGPGRGGDATERIRAFLESVTDSPRPH
ncbi:MAG: response regulator [Gemmatimonadota bacterium]